MSTAQTTSASVPDLNALRASLTDLLLSFRFAELIASVVSLVSRMLELNLHLTGRLAQLTRKGPRSETLERLERQLLLPFSVAVTPRKAKPASTTESEEKPRTRPAASGRSAELPEHLERVQVFNPLTPAQRTCPICGSPTKAIGHAPCERYNIIPARIVVEQRFDETRVCPHDDTIVSAAAPPAIVERGILGNELIIEATCDKFIEHLPIERQATRWHSMGAPISPATLGRAVSAHIDLLMPIANAIEQQTKAPGLLATDATGIPVLDPLVTEGIRTGTMWCWTNALWVTFFYSPTGDANAARVFLDQDLCRAVQCDGTSVMNFIEKAGGSRPGCWAHARRRFAEAARAKDTIALAALRLMAPLFKVERDSKHDGDSAEQRRQRRLDHSKPIIDQVRLFIDEHRGLAPPKTPLGQALGYLHRQWPRLVLFLDDGNIELTNNRRERELRRLVQGRKNWMFTWKDVGAERCAAILTIIATAISYDINPRAYLHTVTKLILNGWPNAKLRDLLPDRIVSKYPELHVPEDMPITGKTALPAPITPWT